jgi:hypothetical protein
VITPIAHMSLVQMLALNREMAQCALHRFAVSSFAEDLRCHVTWRSACRCQDVELLFIHNSRQPKVGNQQIGIVFWCSEQEVLRLQVSMYDAVVVKVCDSRKRGTDEITSVRFVIVALSADAVEKLASKRKVGDKVN